MTEATQSHERATAQCVSRALGEGLRRRRETKGWSRAELVERMPSGITHRTLISYEDGARHLTVPRLLELCDCLDIPAPQLLAQALRSARVVWLPTTRLVDIVALVNHGDAAFQQVACWANGQLDRYPDGAVELTSAAVADLADLMGYSPRDLADYLDQFIAGEPS
jgi:hypothetical protein